MEPLRCYNASKMTFFYVLRVPGAYIECRLQGLLAHTCMTLVTDRGRGKGGDMSSGYYETKRHSDTMFAYNVYPCTIPKDFSFVPLHWQDSMEIIYVKRGSGIVQVDYEMFTAEQGDIYIVLPGHLHGLQSVPRESMEYENIIFSLPMLMAAQGDTCTEKYFQPLVQGTATFRCHFPAGSPQYPALSRCLDAMDEICKTFPEGYQLAIKGQLFSFFYGLAPASSAPLSRQKHKSLDRLKDILKYVETNYHEKITIADAAGICGFSESHFMKFFKTTMAVSFTDYLNSYRLTMAARMLASSSDSIANIAAETGFENLSYFNRVFKRKYGCTPTGFRSRH